MNSEEWWKYEGVERDNWGGGEVVECHERALFLQALTSKYLEHEV